MKTLSLVVTGLGLLSFVLGLIDWLSRLMIFGVSKGGYLRGATALFVLALVFMVYDHLYCRKSGDLPAAKPQA